jgi:hypothetical protein
MDKLENLEINFSKPVSPYCWRDAKLIYVTLVVLRFIEAHP